MKPIAIFGRGGHGKVVIDLIERLGGYTIVGIFDDREEASGHLLGYPVLGGREQLLQLKTSRPSLNVFVAIGSNQARIDISSYFQKAGLEIPVLVHPQAIVGRDVQIGAGTVVMAGVVINACTSIGESVIVNTRASVDHDCRISSGVHIGPGVTLCGGVTVGSASLLGVGSQAIPGVAIGDRVIVGAGATVVGNVMADRVVLGTPAVEKRI